MYLEKVMQEATKKEGAGKVLSVTVKHDDWCNLLNGTGGCNCDPDIEFKDLKLGDE